MEQNIIIPLVAIKCFAYNHEPYLRECLDGFVMQQTDFPFVAIVHDDASTDNSADIIREYATKYPNIIKPIYETENQYSKGDGSLARIMNATIDATGAKYIAVCEGDDYWTDTHKLQKQVDFMEQHNEYGMICSKSTIFEQKTRKFLGIKGNSGDEVFENLFHGHSDLFTATTLFRKFVYDRCLEDTRNLIQFQLRIDTAIYYWFSLNSKIYYMDEPTAVYRVLPDSACHSQNPNTTLKMMQRYLNVKIAFLSYCRGIADDKFSFMLEEIRDYEQQVIDYALYVREEELRRTKRYRLGYAVAKIIRKK